MLKNPNDSIEKQLEKYYNQENEQSENLGMEFTNACMKALGPQESNKTEAQDLKNWAGQLWYTTLAVACCMGLPFVFFPPDNLSNYSPEKDWAESIAAFHQTMAEFSEVLTKDSSGVSLIFALGILGLGVKLLLQPGSKLKKMAFLLVSLNALGFMGKYILGAL